MRGQPIIAVFALSALVSSQTIITDTAGAALQHPIEHSSTATSHTVQLSLSRYLYSGPNGLQIYTRSFNGELTGPTLRLKPGDTFHITMTNDLAEEAFDTASLHNNFKDFDTTVPHTRPVHLPSASSERIDPPIPNPRAECPYARAAYPR